MQIIEIKENQKEIWNESIAENNSEGFLQSWEWGEFQKSLGHKIWRIGIIKNDLVDENERSKFQISQDFKHTPSASQPPLSRGEYTSSVSQSIPIPEKMGHDERGIINSKLISVALIVKYNLPFGRSYLYCPRGPIVKESRIKNLAYRQAGQESRVLDFLFSKIKKIAEKEKAIFLRIDPAIDLNVKSGNLKKSLNEIQPKDTLILDLTKSEEELLKEMKQKTRYNIRLAGRKGIRIKNYESGIKNKKEFKKYFEELWKLVKETSARDKFSSHNKNYYWQMLENLNKMQTAPQPCLSGRRACGTMEPAHEGDIRECRLRAKLYLAEYNNKIIAANIVLFFGDIAVYLHGASSNEYRNLMAPYLLQWRQVLDAKSAGCKEYDFWGIAGNNEKENWKGITRFKKGFGGEEKNYIGAYNLVFDSIGYTMYGFIKLIKSKVVKFIK